MRAHVEDKQLLDTLLQEYDHELQDNERESFQDMREYINGNSIRTLSRKQRLWAEAVYKRVAPTYENLVSSGAVKNVSHIGPLGYEMLPRPLRPPGR